MIIEEDLGTTLDIRRKKIYSDQNVLIRANGNLVDFTVRVYTASIDDVCETNIPIEKDEHQVSEDNLDNSLS